MNVQNAKSFRYQFLKYQRRCGINFFLTIRRSRPLTAAAELRALAPLKPSFIQAHVYSNGIQFLKRCAALGFPFLWASPVGLVSVYGLFGLWPLCSKRKQLLFS